jgi:cell division protein FtsI/penicillin-binding protein 2
MNGTVVAIDPQSGRILAMVNQKLALSGGAQPCSTFKVAVGLAALNENIITKDTKVALGRRYSMDLTQALAHSNNAYFEVLGRRLGFQKVSYYAHQFGMGELAARALPNLRAVVEARRSWQDVLVWREHFHDSAAAWRDAGSYFKWWHAVLPAASGVA